MKINLKVEDARKREVGRQIARIHIKIAEQLNVKTGDVVELKGKRQTYVKIWRSSPSEITQDKIKIDAITRRNLGVNLDDMIDLSPAEVKIAKSVTVKPMSGSTVTNELIPYLSTSFNDKVMCEGDIISTYRAFGGEMFFSIIDTKPNGAVIFNKSRTEVSLFNSPSVEQKEETTPEIPAISYEHVGGLSDAVTKIREMIELPLRYPQIFTHLGLEPPKGLLLYGPPGTGKTLLARAIASETSSTFYTISGPEIVSRYYGESEGKLREIFENAKNNSPAIIFIDEIDSIVPKREGGAGEAERRIVAQLLTLLDGINSRGDVVIIGATNRPNSIDEALRRGGRFDREIEIGIPDTDARSEILHIHTRGIPLAEDVNLGDIANRTHGFVGADLQTLTKEAALNSLHRFLPDITLTKSIEDIDISTLNQLNISMNDFEQAMNEVTPSALREIFLERPNISWDDIGGLNEVKSKLIEIIEWPIKYSSYYEEMEIKSPKGILLYGPPGTGKTMLARAVASQVNANFISIKGPELISKWTGESEKGIREIFRKARAATPCIIFFDEIDSIAAARGDNDSDVINRVVSQLLTEIDGLEEIKGIKLLAATNRPDIIDTALLRPGRFDTSILVDYPDQSSREAIFSVALGKFSTEIDISRLANLTEGFSGAEVSSMITKAKMAVVRDKIETENNQLLLNQEIIEQEIFNYKNTKIENSTDKPNYNRRPRGISEMDNGDFA